MTARQLPSLLLTISLLFALSCAFDTAADSIPLVQHASLSGCGGFAADLDDPEEAPAAYCQAERLDWTYDPASETLALIDRRVLLNCCGDRRIGASLSNGVLTVTETDSPEVRDVRCGCMCTFDFSLTVVGVPDEPVMMELVRDITDDGEGPALIWRDELNPGFGSDSVVIDSTDAGIWCGATDPSNDL
jgi:hypothetical protein